MFFVFFGIAMIVCISPAHSSMVQQERSKSMVLHQDLSRWCLDVCCTRFWLSCSSVSDSYILDHLGAICSQGLFAFIYHPFWMFDDVCICLLVCC